MAAMPSTRAAPIRRFIYLIVDGGNDSHTLHRVDTSLLFAAGVDVGVRARQGPRPPRATLPSPLARFACSASRQFLPLGRGVEKIMGVDRHRHTVILDTRTAAVRAGPDVRHVKWHYHGSTWAEAGGKLYHLGRGPGYEKQECLDFEALTYDRHREDWFWNLLPSPPFESYTNVPIESFANAGAPAGEAGAGNTSAIRISAWNSTYAFDVARASWRKEGDWALPFRGRAQYIDDYGLWFGFTDVRASDLCVADLNAAGKPACRHVWANIDGHANHAKSSYLSYLGSGRFCVTRFFRETDNDERFIMKAVVTAVEATCAAGSASGEMHMVSRASVCYHGPKCNSPCYWAPCWEY